MPTISESMVNLPEEKTQFQSVEAPHMAGGPSIAPPNPTYPRFAVTSLPLTAVYEPDALRQFYRGGVPQSRIFPR